MITAFKISDQKVIKLAECDSVPKVMIIYGKNGAGKSILLDALRQKLTKEFAERGGTVINIASKDRRQTSTETVLTELL